MKLPCSVPILTLNSEKYLPRCLDSLKDFQDVFLLDGNSTDATLEIARHYGRPVHKQVETDEANIEITNFTQMREKALGLTQCDWNLQLDSDEFLSEKLIDEIKQILLSGWKTKVAYNIPKKYMVKEMRIEHSFNYPNYIPRLYNKKSGVCFKKGKIVHEQMFVPSEVDIIDLGGCVYSQLPDNYRSCVKKDVAQLKLMKKSTFSRKDTRMHSVKIFFVYQLRALKIFLKSLYTYVKHGYRGSLPIGHVLRHVRVHLIVSWWRLLMIFGARG